MKKLLIFFFLIQYFLLDIGYCNAQWSEVGGLNALGANYL
jgi:hypothetical protein